MSDTKPAEVRVHRDHGHWEVTVHAPELHADARVDTERDATPVTIILHQALAQIRGAREAAAAAGNVSLKVTGTGFLADPDTAECMQMVLATAALFCSQPENYPQFRRLCMEFAEGWVADWLVQLEPGFLALMAMAMGPDGIDES